MGKDYYWQITDSGICEIVLWADRNYISLRDTGLPVRNPDEIKKTDYDQVLIALLDEEVVLGIKRFLMKNYRVPDNLIIWSKGDHA